MSRVAGMAARLRGLLAWAGAASFLACSADASRATNPGTPISLSAPEIVTAPGRTGVTQIVVNQPDTSATYRFAIAVDPVNGSAGVDAQGAVWFTAAPSFSGRDSLTVRVGASRSGIAETDLRIHISVDPPGQASSPLRVYSSPYATVAWATDPRLKVQLHDHDGVATFRLRAYDRAGYDVMSLMDYSGIRSLPYALDSVLWPPDKYLSPTFLSQLAHIKFFIPSAEQVGYAHLVSPFLTTYLERWQDSLTATPPKQAWHYENSQEAIDLINRFGGTSIVAHPWYSIDALDGFAHFAGVEVYSAFARFRAEEGVDTFFTMTDRNAVMRAAWDRKLLSDQAIVGVAVNDHFGPDNTATNLTAKTRDSGKIIAITKGVTMGDLETALRRGHVFAIMDIGDVKDQYPRIDSISLQLHTVTIETGDEVLWIANGHPLVDGKTLDFAKLPAGTTFVRAEVRNSDGSTVFTQAFPVRQVGDMDGDGDVDAADAAVCTAVRAGTDLDINHAAACYFVQESAGALRGAGAAPPKVVRPRKETALLPRWRRGNGRARYDFPECAEYPD